MKHLILLLLLLCAIGQPLIAQTPSVSTPVANLADIQNYRDYQNMVRDNLQEENLILYFYPCLNGSIDLRDFKRRNLYTGVPIPDFKPIIFPELSADMDTVYAVGFLKSKLSGQLMLNVILISGYNSAVNPVYYIDKNADADFSNDEPFTFKGSKRKIHYTTIKDSNKNLYEFKLYSQHEVVKIKEKKEKLKRPERSFSGKHFSNNSVYMSLGLTTGSGNFGYDFRDQDTNFPTDYTSNYFPVGLMTDISYNYGRFSIGAAAKIGLINNYSSQRESQIKPITEDKPFFLETNYDGRPKNFLQYGLTFSYNIKTFSIVTVTPELGLYKINYLGHAYQPNRRSDPETTFDYSTKPFFTVGIAGKLALNEKSLFFIKGRYEHDRFSPEGLYDTFNTQSVNSFHYRVMFELGIQWRLGGAKKIED